MKHSIKCALVIIPILSMIACNSPKQNESEAKKPIVKTDLSQKDYDDNIVINMATFGFDDWENGVEQVKKFNEADNGYCINVIDYSDFYNFDNSTTNIGEAYANADNQIMYDIINKNEIDMMVDLLNEDRILTLSQKGAFVDLNTFLKDDSEINDESLNRHVLDLCEINDKLFFLPLGYTVNTMYGSEKNVGNKENWNISEMKKRWEQMPVNSSFISSNSDNTSSSIFFSICQNSIASFIDYENHLCNFDSEDFVELLSFINTFDKECVVEKEDRIVNDIFLYPVEIDSIEKYRERLLYNGNQEKISFVGYPSVKSGYSFIRPISMVEICAKASPEVQKGAWEFIRYLVDEEFQYDEFCQVHGNEYYEEYKGLSINNKAYEKKAKEIMSKSDEENTLLVQGQVYDMGQFTTSDLELLKKVINDTNKINLGGFDLQSIIYEEVNTMIEGGQTPKETAHNIQNRASILLSE